MHTNTKSNALIKHSINPSLKPPVFVAPNDDEVFNKRVLCSPIFKRTVKAAANTSYNPKDTTIIIPSTDTDNRPIDFECNEILYSGYLLLIEYKSQIITYVISKISKTDSSKWTFTVNTTPINTFTGTMTIIADTPYIIFSIQPPPKIICDSFKPHPIKHWRFQLFPQSDKDKDNTISTKSISIGDRPGQITVTANLNAQALPCNIKTNVNDIKLLTNHSKPSCACTTRKSESKLPYYKDKSAYLQSRGKLFEQNEGSQPTTASCRNPPIHNPSNKGYSTRGAVSSGSRMQRLKQNTIYDINVHADHSNYLNGTDSAQGIIDEIRNIDNKEFPNTQSLNISRIRHNRRICDPFADCIKIVIHVPSPTFNSFIEIFYFPDLPFIYEITYFTQPTIKTIELTGTSTRVPTCTAQSISSSPPQEPFVPIRKIVVTEYGTINSSSILSKHLFDSVIISINMQQITITITIMNPNLTVPTYGYETDFGSCIAFYKNDYLLLIGAPSSKLPLPYDDDNNITFAGAVYVYKLQADADADAGLYTFVTKLYVDDSSSFGCDIKWSSDGTYIAIGAADTVNEGSLNTGSVYIYKYNKVDTAFTFALTFTLQPPMNPQQKVYIGFGYFVEWDTNSSTTLNVYSYQFGSGNIYKSVYEIKL